jgi:four helix bundle protein
MAITRFEDIHAWQAARELCTLAYQLTRSAKFRGDFALRDQVQRAGISIMANIAEGFDCRSNSEFIQFLYYALRSASELQSHFYVAQDQNYVLEAEFAEVYDRASSVKRMIFKFIQHLRARERR